MKQCFFSKLYFGLKYSVVVGFLQDELRKLPKDKISWDDFFNDGQC